jgi:hypothetical protein
MGSSRRYSHPMHRRFAINPWPQTNEPHQRVTTALAWAKPERPGVPGYIA